MNNNNLPVKHHNRYYYQIPINIAFLAISILFTLMVEQYEHQIGGGISRPLLFLLINVEIFIAILLAASIIRQSVILFLERRQKRPGSVFKKNLLFSFIFLSILPGIFIFLGASKLVVKHLDLWFGARIEQGLTSGLTAYQESTISLRVKLNQTGTSLTAEWNPQQALPKKINGFDVYWWPKKEGEFNLASEVAQWRAFRELNDRPTKKLKADFLKLFFTRSSDNTVIVDFYGSIYWLKAYHKGMLAIIHRPPPPLRNALIKIQNARSDYINVREVKHVLKFNFYLQAILLLFLILVLAIWCSFYLARGISEPIQQLLEATNAVRAGNLQAQVQTTGSPDLQALAQSFNEMTKALAASHQALAEKNAELLSHMVKINTFKTWQEAVKQIAHEIKNPLTPIQLTTQRLQRKCLSTLTQETAAIFNDGCTIILGQVEVIKNLVADFSSFAVPSKLELRYCLLEAIINDVVKLFELSYPSIKLIQLYENTSKPLMLDAEKIKRVLVNLLINSIEAFKNYSCQTPTITIQVTSEEKNTRITFTDNGPGIAPEIIDKLFLPYISTGKKNMGLGLAITQEIIMQHGGKITVAKSLLGASFIIDLPNTKEKNNTLPQILFKST
jgi:nitrogen fixation/metabolism regulation signal transduction histidine kinase